MGENGYCDGDSIFLRLNDHPRIKSQLFITDIPIEKIFDLQKPILHIPYLVAFGSLKVPFSHFVKMFQEFKKISHWYVKVLDFEFLEMF